ncbi:MAG: ribonuclease H-like domain-containing protein [Vicinamibacterales bacterium]
MKPSLADRLRAVVGGAAAVPRVHPDAGGPDRPGAGSSLEAPDGEALPALVAAPDGAAQDARRLRAARAAGALGGTVETRADGYCIVVERHYAADQRHGRHRVGDIVTMLRAAEDGLADLRRAWPVRGGDEPGPGPVPGVDGLGVVDLETTGLAGGAGTQAFLVGCARVHGDGLVVRQYLSPGFEFERTQLALVAEWLRERSHLVTFNGRTFDLPLLEMRFSFNRLAWPCGACRISTRSTRRAASGAIARSRPAPIPISRAVRSACSSAASPACIGWATCRASRSPRGSSSSRATDGRSRWGPCSNTTGSISSRRCSCAPGRRPW